MKNLLLFLILPFGLFAQSQTKVAPDCTLGPGTINFSTTGSSDPFDNRPTSANSGIPCTNWTLEWSAQSAVTSLTINIQGAPDNNGSPGSYSTFATATTFPAGKLNFTSKTLYFPWVRVNVSAVGAGGLITGILNGFRENSDTIGGGGGSSAGGYDLIEVNGTPFPAETVLNFITGTNSTPNCVDVSGTSTNCTFNVSGGGGGPTTNQNVRAVSFLFDGQGSALSGTVTRCQQINYSGTIQEVTLVADQSGSATIDIQTVIFGSYTGPSSASSITASDKPTLSTAVKYQDSTLTGWTTAFAANTVVCVVLSSPSTVTWVAGNFKIAAN
jgi:hypothetical protein